MWCTTECWDCEDRKCEHYISKTELYFENQKKDKEIEKLNNIIKSARDLFYEKCRISQNGVYTFNQVDYEELDNVLKGVDKE